MANLRRNKRQSSETEDESCLASEQLPPPDSHAHDMLPIEGQSALFNSIFTLSSDAIVYIDPSFVIRAANENYAKQVRLPVETILVCPLEEVSHGWIEQLRHIYREVRKTGKSYHYGAMGIGLFISKEIVTLHGGGMRFGSRVQTQRVPRRGKGSTFYFSLPLAYHTMWLW